MKVLWLCSWYPNKLDKFGGDFIERHAIALSSIIPIDVIHIVQNNTRLKNAKAATEVSCHSNIRFILKIIPYHITGFSFLNKIIFNWRYIRQLKNLLNQYIQENGKPDLVHVHVPVKMGAGALYLKKKYNIPFVATEHNSAYFNYIPENYHNSSNYFRYITRKTFESAMAVSSVSHWLLNRLSDLFTLKSGMMIRNVVDDSLFFYIPTSNNVKRFIHVSMMEPLKNVKGMLDAFIALNVYHTSWELVLVGPCTEEYQQLVRNSGIGDKVIFTGLITYPEVASQMRNADVLVHFSRYENLPCVINEALCCGLTVITSDVGGIHEIISEDNGIMVQSEDVIGLKNAIDYYLGNSERYSRKNIAAQAASVYNYKTIGLELYNWYKDLLKG